MTWKRRLLDGRSHTDIERLLEGKKTKQLTALALFDDESRAGDVMSKLNAWDRRLADVYRAINEGAHGVPPGGFGPLISSTRNLVKRIRELA